MKELTMAVCAWQFPVTFGPYKMALVACSCNSSPCRRRLSFRGGRFNIGLLEIVDWAAVQMLFYQVVERCQIHGIRFSVKVPL